MCRAVHKTCLIALGGNVAGAWGPPLQTAHHVLESLVRRGFRIVASSPPYITRPSGNVRQPPYLNMVFAAECDYTSRQIIQLFKRLERSSGRRLGMRNGPRPLDLDLLDYNGKVLNWPPVGARPPIILPHPLLAERSFVLVPLCDVAPQWHHPVLGRTARQLLQQIGGINRIILRGDIYRVDSRSVPCEWSPRV